MKNFKAQIVDCFKLHLGENLVSLALFGSRARGSYREGSDYDLFLIAEKLPENWWERIKFIRQAYIGKFPERISVIARTREEFLKHFPPLYLDLALDAQILYDKNFLFPKLEQIKDLIEKVGLRRKSYKGSYYWEWERQPSIGWELSWEGLSECRG